MLNFLYITFFWNAQESVDLDMFHDAKSLLI